MEPHRKAFRISKDQIRPLATELGVCVASDRITIDGSKVGFMYREEPANEIDSGWRFLAGDESDEYMSNSDNHSVHDVNTIANYDPEIIPLLETRACCAFERMAFGAPFVEVEFEPTED